MASVPESCAPATHLSDREVEAGPSERLKILFLTNSLGTGGIETNLLRLSKALNQRGHQVLIAARPGVLTNAAMDSGATLIDLQVKITDATATFKDVRTLRKVIRDEKPDLIHVFSASTGILLRLSAIPLRKLSWRTKIPVVSSIMGLVNHPDEPTLIGYARLLATILGSQRVFITSPAIEHSTKWVPARRSRFARQRVHGVERRDGFKSDPASVKQELGLPPDRPLVITIGRLDPTKSHELFVAMAAEVVSVEPEVQFAIVGEGTLRNELQDQIHRTGLSGVVHMLGERHDVSRLLSASHICVRPGIVEGFVGLTVLEAQALAIPTIAFETEDVKLAIRHGETGLLVRPRDVKALANAVIDLLHAPDEAKRLGEAGKRHFESTFSLDQVVLDLENRYRFEIDRYVWSTNASDRYAPHIDLAGNGSTSPPLEWR